jgi:methyl-accepting chemotaxis protein
MKRERRKPLSLTPAELAPETAVDTPTASEPGAQAGFADHIPPPPAEPAPIRSAVLRDPIPRAPDEADAAQAAAARDYALIDARDARRAKAEAGKAAKASARKAKAEAAPAARSARSPALPKARPPARWAYWVGGTCAVLWAGAFLAFVLGFGRLGPFDYAPFRDGVVAALAVLPALFMLLFAYALRQGARLGEDVRRTRALADDLVGPVALAAVETGDLMQTVRGEIDRAAEAAEAANARLSALREGLAEESRRLSEAAQEAHAGAQALATALGRERGALEGLSASLELRTAEITETVSRQSRLAADVSDLAQVQLAEAQAALAARAADLTAAAADARDGAEAAAAALSLETGRLGEASDGLGERLSRLGAELSRERDQLAKLADALRIDHDDLAARAESQHARLAETGREAKAEVEAASSAAEDAAASLRALIAETAEQVRAAALHAAEARAQAVAQAEGDLDRLDQTARRRRTEAAEEAHRAAQALADAADRAHAAAAARLSDLESQAERLGEAALQRIEQLGEAAFAAGQRADQAFDTRIAAAKRAIDQSAAAVEAAGLRSAERIEAGLAGARSALAELDALLAEVDGRFESLPAEAQRRAEAVRSAVERGVGDLTAAARRAAEETQAIDAAFQERVRRNYDTLSEAVRLMGRVAGAVDAAARTPDLAPATAPAVGPAVPPLTVAATAPPAAAPQTLAPARAEPAPLPIAVGDSHPRFASTAELAVPRTPPPRLFVHDAGEAPSPRAGSTWGEAADLFAPPGPRPAADAREAGLRPRLKLTPPEDAAADDPLAGLTTSPRDSTIFAPRAPEPPPAAGKAAAGEADAPAWGWKTLLAGLPGEADAPAAEDDEALADRLISEIEALGLQASALLPRTQVEELAHQLAEGRGGVREGVRRLAPAAVRRLSRRVLTDAVLRREADAFVRRYGDLVTDAVRRDRDGFLASALLGSDAGRAYLLLDAAIGDLTH